MPDSISQAAEHYTQEDGKELCYELSFFIFY